MNIDILDIINIDFLIKNNTTSKEIDLLFQKFLIIKDDYNHPIIEIELKTNKQLEYMMTNADNIHMYCENNIFRLIAYYDKTESYPIARAYYIKIKNLLPAAKYREKYEIKNIYGPHTYPEFLQREGDYLERIQNYVKRNKEKNAIMSKLFYGRKKNTNTEFGLRLNTDNCIFCSKEKKYTMNTTLSWGKGFLFSYDVCQTCFNDINSKNVSALNYFAQNYTNQDLISLSDISPKELLDDTKNFLKDELDCIIEQKKSNKKDIITAIRKKSKIKIIFRITSPLNYAYIFFDKENHQFARIDSANDHPELEFGPDHLHDSTNKKNFNKKVKESFTLGLPSIDKKAIIKIINDKEH